MDFGQHLSLTDIHARPNLYVDRKIVVEEVLRDKQSNTTLIRTISCHKRNYEEGNLHIEVLQNSSTTSLRSKCPDEYSSYKSHVAYPRCKSDTYLKPADSYEEPMEVDSSGDQLQLGNSKTSKLRSLNLRRKCKEHKSDVVDSVTETNSSIVPLDEPLVNKFHMSVIILSTLFAIWGVYIVVTGDRYVYVNRDLQAQNIKEELVANILYQEDAMEIIIQSFNKMDSWREQVKVLPFVGSTGVGKTFTANLIKKHFFPHLIHEVSGQILANAAAQRRVLENLIPCCCNLIVIDDLKASDLVTTLQFIKTLPRSQHLLVIPVFNIQDTTDGLNYKINRDDYRLIRDEFDRSGVFHELVVFDVLKHHMLATWVRSELRKRNIDKSRHEALIKFLLDDNHAKHKGFKGLNAKLLLALSNAQ